MLLKQNTAPVIKNESSGGDAIGKYLAYWPWFLISLIIAVAGAFFYLRYAIPKFEATASLIIKDKNKGDVDNQSMEALDMINSKKIIENEIEVFQSWTLMNTVVKNLGLYAPVSQEGTLKAISAYVVSPIKIEAENPDSLDSYDKIPLSFDKKKGIVRIDTTMIVAPLNEWVKTPYGTLRFSLNEKYRQGDSTKPFFFSLYPSKTVAAGIANDLKVSASSKLSSVIDLSYRDQVPKRAEDVLNELINNYRESSLSEKNTLAKNTLAFIEVRLNAVKKDLDSVEKKLQQYKTGSGAVDITKQSQLYLESVSANDRKLSELDLQLAAVNQLEKAASASGNVGLLPSTLGVNDPELTSQLNSLNTLQQQYDKLKPTVAENNPLLVSVVEQIKRIRPSILSNIQSQRKNLEHAKSSITADGNVYNSMVSAIPQKEKQLIEISRDQNIKNGIYSFLLQKREESELSYASTITDSRVINYALSGDQPVSPKKIIILFIAFALGVGLPFLVITARDVMSRKVLSKSEIANFTRIPIIAEMPFDKSSSKNTVVVQTGKRTVIAEQFRKLRVSLLALKVGPENKKVLITSSISGEGKSFIATNLATSISLTGKKVVLVDMDLHNPGLEKFFNIAEQHSGVGDYLVGKCDLQSIIFNVPGNENLFYISAGTLQNDASELLENGKVRSLIDKLDAGFDMVIIDTAPVVLITDAFLLSSLCDATLYVIRHQFTPKSLVKRIDENNIINPIKNPGIIFNGIKQIGFLKNSYGYGYSNYVYGSAEKGKKKKSKKLKKPKKSEGIA